jgi:hypothetical protein
MGHQRLVNVVLCKLVHLRYPGEVPSSSERILPQSWKEHTLATDLTYRNDEGVVWSDLWASFLIMLTMLEFDIAESDPEYMEHMIAVFNKNAMST